MTSICAIIGTRGSRGEGYVSLFDQGKDRAPILKNRERRHCEGRSDAAIQEPRDRAGLLRSARNDSPGVGAVLLIR
jgi:hypothetical protein